MAKARVKVRPSGLINGRDWPEVGEVVDLPDDVVEGMVKAGWLEVEKAEKPAKKAAAKKAAEKRPASDEGVEKR